MKAADLSKWLAFGTCRVRSITGYNNQASDCYILLCEQSADSPTAIAAGTVVTAGVIPKMAGLLAPTKGEFKYEWAEGITFAELCVAISTVQASLTYVAAAGAIDMTIDIDGPYLVDNYTGITMVGDLTTNVTTLQVWAEASGPKTLARVDVKSGDATITCFVGYAVDAPASTSLPQFSILVSGTTLVFPMNCGAGSVPFQQNADFTQHKGLTIQGQVTRAAQANPGKNGKIRAIYFT